MLMRKHKLLPLLILLLAITQSCSLLALPSASASSGEWTMFRYDLSRTGYTTGNGAAASVRQLWNFSTSASVLSSPAVSDGKVVVGCKDCRLYCLNASTGEQLWNFTAGHEVNSSPAIDNGYVYVGSDDGWVYCIELATGSPRWISKVGGVVRSSPAVADGYVFIGSGSHDLFCFNASTGDVVWTFPTRLRVDSSPAVVDGVVYFASDDFFTYAVNASTGEEIWHQHTGSNMNSPCVADGYLYIGSYDSYVFALNASTGAKIWRYLTRDSVTSSAAVAYGRVYVGSQDGSIYCLNATSGEKLWETSTGYWVWSSPAVSDGNVFVGSEDYNIYCLDAFTGQVKWKYQVGCYVDSSPTIVNGILYVGSHDYHVYALTLSDSTVEPPPVEASDAIKTSTIVFDILACAVGAVIVFTIAYYVRSSRKNKLKVGALTSPEKQSWFSAHLNALTVLVLVIFAVAFFASLGAGPLWAADEKTYSQMAHHMLKSGDYLLPWAYGEPAIWTGKPPVLMWLMALSYQAFGVNNYSTRLWNPMFGILSLVIMFYLGKKLYNEKVGFLSVVVLGTFITFFEFATHAMTDGPLLFFMLASIYFMILSEEKNSSYYAALGGLFFGLALMTKQIQALLIPLIIIAYFVATKRSLRFFFTKSFTLFWVVPVLVCFPYVLYMTMRFRDFWDCYLIYCVVERATTPIEGHAGSPLFYIKYLVTGENLLWVALLPFSVVLCGFNAFVKRHKSDILIFAWMAIVLVLFSVAQTKLYWYILPALPAFAFAISNFIYQASKKLQLRFNTHQKGD
jgi:outer membrane protein assembly factor BamB